MNMNSHHRASGLATVLKGIRFIAVLVFCISIGCMKTTDAKMPEVTTLVRLRALASYISEMSARDKDVSMYATVHSLLSDVNEVGLLGNEAYSEKELERDGWKRPFAWSVIKADQRCIIRVVSGGKNGIFEGGKGDDLSIEVIIKRGRQTHTRMRVPSCYDLHPQFNGVEIISY